MVNLTSLVEITCYRSNNCFHLSSLGRLPCLRVINLHFMASLKCFHDSDDETMSSDTIMFPVLQKLQIDGCHNLVSLPTDLPKLQVLELEECGELVSLPRNIPKLKVLKLEDCRKLVFQLDELQSFTDLNQLEINGFDELLKWKASKRYRCEFAFKDSSRSPFHSP